MELSKSMLAEPDRHLPFARLVCPREQASSNRCFLTGFHFKDLELPPTTIERDLRQVAGGEETEWRLQLQASAYAWAVHLQVPGSVWVEDDYFDLLPGERREVALRGPAEDVAELQVSALNGLLGQGRR
jgi:hypothetical protein